MKSPILGSTHTHSTGSDGSLNPGELVQEAIKHKFKYIYFTDHYIFPPGFREKDAEDYKFFSKKYLDEVAQTRKKYKNKIDIGFGAEICWLEKYSDWIKEEIKRMKFDYVIGSAHFVKKDNEYFVINASEKYFHEITKKFNGIENFVKEYYNQIRQMANSKIFNCIGHFDLIKIYNENNSIFSENSEWYRQEVEKTLDTIKKSGMCIEINTSGLSRKCKEQYPSLWILKEARKRNIPITIGSDGHRLESIFRDLDKGFEIAKSLGFDYIVRFKKRKMIKERI